MPGLIDVSSVLGVSPVLLAFVLIWSLIWKGLALWKSARKSSLIWFIVFLVVNTIGILEILYIFVFSKMGKKPEQKVEKPEKIEPKEEPKKRVKKK